MIDEPTGSSDAEIESESASMQGHASSRDPLGLDHVYEALGHPRRRYLCYSLLGDEDPSLSELATKIAAWENDVSEEAVEDSVQERVYVSLYHAHVPKLVDDGIVDFDEATETLTAAENADRVLGTLEALQSSLDDGQAAHARGDDRDHDRKR
jgi:hypothetical protein